jgi:membrane protein implicated in regulation of membrane protease activity
MGRLVGQTGTVSQAIADGEGRVRQGDSEWLARGPDLAAGARVRITGFEGGTLLVEPLRLLKDEGTLPPDIA